MQLPHGQEAAAKLGGEAKVSLRLSTLGISRRKGALVVWVPLLVTVPIARIHLESE